MAHLRRCVILMLFAIIASLLYLATAAKKTKNEEVTKPETGATKPAFVAVKRCQSPLTFKALIKPGYIVVDSGGVDESDKPLGVCKSIVGGKILLGKGYLFAHNVDGVHVIDNCWVVAPNGTELTIHTANNVTYLQTRAEDNVVVWANIKNFPDFPNISPTPIFSRTGKSSNSTKQYPARCNHEGEDGAHHLIPGVINENDVTKAIITYGGNVIECENFDVPVCI